MNTASIVNLLEFQKGGGFEFDFSNNNVVKIEGTKE